MLKRCLLPLNIGCLALSAPRFAFKLIGPKWEGGNVSFDTSFAGNNNPNGFNWGMAMREAANKWDNQVDGLNLSYSTNGSHPCAGYASAFPEDNQNASGFIRTPAEMLSA